MRKIKFRIWDKDIEEMLYSDIIESGHLFGAEDGQIKFWREEEIQDDINEPPYIGGKEVEGELMQYTGLVDKNGKEIYEGDKVRLDDVEATIKFFDGKFQMITDKNQGQSPVAQERLKHFEVIGNIWEDKI